MLADYAALIRPTGLYPNGDSTMAGRQINFYATYNDIGEVLEKFEAQEDVRYVQTGLFDNDCRQVFESYRAINSLAVSADGDANHVPGYLIIGKAGQIVVRNVPQKTGGIKFAIDQSAIPDSLYFQSGGKYSDIMIVPGRIGIAYQTAIANRLFDAFAKLIRKNFKKVKSYYVGGEAYGHLQTGMRLGLSLKASTDVDLRE
jgi:hypothetical protein